MEKIIGVTVGLIIGFIIGMSIVIVIYGLLGAFTLWLVSILVPSVTFSWTHGLVLGLLIWIVRGIFNYSKKTS